MDSVKDSGDLRFCWFKRKHRSNRERNSDAYLTKIKNHIKKETLQKCMGTCSTGFTLWWRWYKISCSIFRKYFEVLRTKASCHVLRCPSWSEQGECCRTIITMITQSEYQHDFWWNIQILLILLTVYLQNSCNYCLTRKGNQPTECWYELKKFMWSYKNISREELSLKSNNQT